MRLLLPLLIVVSAVLVSGAQATAKPTSTIQLSKTQVSFGDVVKLSGTLSSHQSGKHIVIQAKPFGYSRMIALAEVKTGAGGHWSLSATPAMLTLYRAQVGSRVSRTVQIAVRPKVVASEHGDGSVWVRVLGFGTGAFYGDQVKLQQMSGGSWTTLAQQTLGTSSTTVFDPSSLGTSSLRVVMSINQAGNGYLGAFGRPFPYTQYALTLSLSADKVLFGHKVKLSGRLVNGRAGEHITLTAWPYGYSAPVLVTTNILTGTGGTWSFSVKPTVQTAYQVNLARETSIRAVVGVQPRVTVAELQNGRVRATVHAGRSLKGRSVELQKLNGGAWQTVAKKPLGRSSNVVFAVGLPVTTIRTAISVNQSGAGLLGSVSHPLIYHPLGLTLHVSGFKTLFGHSVTLTGRLMTGKQDQRVSILAWPYGRSAPIRVGTVFTKSHGDWSMLVKPKIQTSYVARWQSIITPKLTIGVRPLITATTLASGRISVHITAAKTFSGRFVQLQQLLPSRAWVTLSRRPLNRNASVIFPAFGSSNNVTLRVAMSVNQAGAGYLGTNSDPFTYDV